ncbi:MAG: bifunctional UDP-N-acetylglucosamine diphosphorylase/glucosamine-1-phosphate N-acetyltransferase GlmU [Bacteriovoracaceae bacterium]|jgi:bifunctional UDP-N-acetylglucosamine pyrophosphorylase/glucosamine-1-phosphate N-acetyltransferase|nr:bifunctional UDP-N-acetylglucosamine diphosphorylase/glucosamine-1-phosphate N-acetyltransferase GlmU [Bacteriovoracaceae bacterium]
MSDKISIVILAAGKGTRLKMDIPKPLVKLEKHSLVDYVINASKNIGDICLVTGHQKQLVEQHIEDKFKDLNISFVHQQEQLGTGHAVQTYIEQFSDFKSYKYTIVACADTPLLEEIVFKELIEKMTRENLDAVATTFKTENPFGYGRIVRSEVGGLSIVEQKDTSDEQRLINEVNAGLYIFKTDYLAQMISSLDNDNNSGEFYLTDTFKEGANVKALMFEDKNYFLGINDLYQLSVATRKYMGRNIKNLSVDGVRFLDVSHTYCFSKKIGQGTLIYPNAHIDSASIIGRDVIIEPGCFIENSTIEDGAHIKANSYITDSIVRKKAKIGPMVQLRPGSDIGEGAKLGNFVEIKKSIVRENASVSHLSYIGDADIGKDVNIGCGFITCNYDGANKHKTVIGEGSFIGSDCQMIAPINIGKKAYIGSGSTINKNVPDGAFAIARERQVTKEGMAKKFIKIKDKK